VRRRALLCSPADDGEAQSALGSPDRQQRQRRSSGRLIRYRAIRRERRRREKVLYHFCITAAFSSPKSPFDKLFILNGEPAGIRTQDPRLKRALLYQLSYELTPVSAHGAEAIRFSGSGLLLAPAAILQPLRTATDPDARRIPAPSFSLPQPSPGGQRRCAEAREARPAVVPAPAPVSPVTRRGHNQPAQPRSPGHQPVRTRSGPESRHRHCERERLQPHQPRVAPE
jgi:hypothetical protein